MPGPPARGRERLNMASAAPIEASPRGEQVARLAAVLDCAEDVSRAILDHARQRDYAPRAVLVSCGETCKDVFILLAGHARANALSVDGRAAVVEEYGAGDIVGEAALLDRFESRHEVVAIDKVCAAVLLAHAMIALMTNHAGLALAMSRRMIARVVEQNRRLAESSTLSAAGRVHAEVLRLARAGEGMSIRPSPVLSQLALHVQSTRETVSRAISALEKRGIIRRDEEALTVVAEHRLEELIY